MIKRIVEISGMPAALSLRDRQLLIERHDMETARVPIEDLGMLIVDQPAVTYTHPLLTALVGEGVAIILCGANHHPAGLFLPFDPHSLHAEVLRHQVEAGQSLLEKLWMQVVSAKIRNQADALKVLGRRDEGLEAMAGRVKRGDDANLEAQAAQRYWPRLFGEGFRRQRGGPPPNNLLNYGYMVLRAATARAICGAGLHPAIGIYHRNRYNPFCLADDLMEPIRPVVDLIVARLYAKGARAVDRDAKNELLAALTTPVMWDGESSPLQIAIQRSAVALREAMRDEGCAFVLPGLHPRAG